MMVVPQTCSEPDTMEEVASFTIRVEHQTSATGLRRSSLTRKPNATIKTPLALNSMCAITMSRNHCGRRGEPDHAANRDLKPLSRQRLRLSFKRSMSVATRISSNVTFAWHIIRYQGMWENDVVYALAMVGNATHPMPRISFLSAAYVRI